MTRDWLIVGAVFVVLWLFWAWICSILDWIHERQHGGQRR